MDRPLEPDIDRRGAAPIPGVQIRSAIPGDEGILAALLREAYRTDPSHFLYTAEEFEAGAGPVVIDASSTWSIACIGGELVGCVQMAIRSEIRARHKAELRRLYVTPRRRREGVGARIVTHALATRPQHVDFVRLYVNAEDPRGRDFYTSLGFVSYAVEPFARMHDGEAVDEEIMQIDLRKRRPPAKHMWA